MRRCSVSTESPTPSSGERSKALPQRTSENARLWDSCLQRAMELQRCSSCRAFRYYPAPICPECASLDFDWERITGRGTVYSFTWVYRAAPGFERDVPYAYALVQLEEGPVMATNIVNVGEDELAIGMPVTIHYRDVTPEFTLPLFEPLR